MDNYTEQDELNIEAYREFKTEDLFDTIEALHILKNRKHVEPELEDQAKNTISIIRDILIERNAVN
jgi:hypothetical protein